MGRPAASENSAERRAEESRAVCDEVLLQQDSTVMWPGLDLTFFKIFPQTLFCIVRLAHVKDTH